MQAAFSGARGSRALTAAQVTALTDRAEAYAVLSPLNAPSGESVTASSVGAAPPRQRAQAAVRAAATTASTSSKVQKPRRHTSKTKLGLYHVSRRVFVARPASLPEREQRLVLLRPGPLPTPDAGKASLHAGPTAGNLGRRARRRLSKHSHVPGEEQPNNLSIFRPSGDGDHT